MFFIHFSIDRIELASNKGIGGKLDKQCFMYVVRKDRQKFTRVQKLLKTNEELKEARTSEIAKEEPTLL